MRVSTRILAGAVFLMVLGLLVFVHLSLIQEIQKVNNELANRLPAARTAESVLDEVEAIDGFSQKYFGLELDYGPNVEDAHENLRADIARLKIELGPHPASVELKRLEDVWAAYRPRWEQAAADWQKLLAAKSADSVQADMFQQNAALYIKPVYLQAQRLNDAIYEAFQDDVEQAAATGSRVKTVSWIVAVIVPALGIVSIFLLRTINASLNRLTAGTRMIAQGQFWHRLPTGGADEFSELAADFNTMSERLERLDSMKKDFVSHVSHELKAPLASIRQTFHLLLEHIPGPLNDQQERLLRLSNRSAERLSAMVGNLLDASRMDSGSMEYSFAPVDLLPLARSVAEEFEVQARDKDIALRVEAKNDAGFVVECDKDRMSQVIGNLFDNALKFSPRGSEVVASIQTKENGTDRSFVFSVRDCGIGVPDDHKAGVFGMFYQVKQGKKLSGQGVGLGLAICRSILEAHRGRIWVEDNATGGSVFYFELPAMARVEAATA